MKILYESECIDYATKDVTKNNISECKCQKTEEIDKTKINGFYNSVRVVEHNGYKFTYRFKCYNWRYFTQFIDKEMQALYVMVNGKWEYLIGTTEVGLNIFDERIGDTAMFDEARDTMFNKFDEYIQKVY